MATFHTFMSWFKTVRYEFCLCNGQGPIFQSENVQNFQLEASKKPQFKPEVESDLHPEVLPDKILSKKPQFKPEVEPDLHPEVSPDKILSKKPQFKSELDPDLHPKVLPDKIFRKKPQFQPEVEVPNLHPEVSMLPDKLISKRRYIQPEYVPDSQQKASQIKISSKRPRFQPEVVPYLHPEGSPDITLSKRRYIQPDYIPEIQFIYFPDEILLKVLSYLPVKDLIPCGQVSKRIRAISHDEILWQRINLHNKVL